MNITLRATALLAALAFAGGAYAQGQSSGLSYDYAELTWVNAETDLDGGDLDGDGFALNGSYEFAPNFHVFGGFASLDLDGPFDTTAFEIGAGYHQPIANGTDFVGRLSYIDGEVDTPFGDADDSGFGLSAGFRHIFTPEIQAAAFLNHADLDDSGSETSVEVFGEYFFTPEFTAGLSLEFGDDATVWSIGGRWYFGNRR